MIRRQRIAAYAVIVATLAGILVAVHFLPAQAGSIAPYAYRTSATVNGITMRCTMTVDSYGNGSLGNCGAP